MTPSFLSARRERLRTALAPADDLLVGGAGEPVPLPEGTDQTYPYRAHAEYVFTAGFEGPGGVVAYDPREGAAGWRSFVPPVTEAERVWCGARPREGEDVAGFPAWLHAGGGRRIAARGCPVAGVTADAAATDAARLACAEVRRPKDAHELDLIGRAVAATSAGFARLPDLIRPGVKERTLQIELEAAFQRAGADRTGYGTIVGAGPNAAVLHFEPSARAVAAGDFVLVDAGAEVRRYVADVTRTYVAGEPTGFQRDLHAAVRWAQERAIARCVPGAEWKEIHLAAAVDLTAGLVGMGLLRGQPESLVEQEVHALFFPHGLGHLVGLGVRDASGLARGRTRDPRPSLRSLRMDLPLAEGFVVTVEPGLYFIPALLQDPVRRERHRDTVNWSLVEANLGLGGVRIEDDVLVRREGPEVLTAGIPKTLA
ncbi:MAG: aminopeptidase P N-terminal domain-containing protein [Opitutaceae bacterium]